MPHRSCLIARILSKRQKKSHLRNESQIRYDNTNVFGKRKTIGGLQEPEIWIV